MRFLFLAAMVLGVFSSPAFAQGFKLSSQLDQIFDGGFGEIDLDAPPVDGVDLPDTGDSGGAGASPDQGWSCNFGWNPFGDDPGEFNLNYTGSRVWVDVTVQPTEDGVEYECEIVVH